MNLAQVAQNVFGMCVGHVLEMLGTCFGPVSTIAIAGVNVNFCHALSESCSVLLTFDTFGIFWIFLCLFFTRQADYYRYIAEFRSGDEKSKAAEEARKAYADAAKVAKDDLAVTHPIRLGLALNYSVFMYEVLNDPDEACKMARTAFEDKWFKHVQTNHAKTC